MDRIYTQADISKSLNDGKWEEDGYGNPIIIIDASNENLDYDGEKVMRDALMGSKDYFLQNGVISYDHKHILHGEDAKAYDADYNAEKYILGKPLDVWVGENSQGKPTVKVKAVLSRSNNIAKEIISKLKDGLKTVKASVGGRRVQKINKFDEDSFSEVPTIVGVNWDEVALTYKPVNQTLDETVLCPAEFVKSLTAGSSADPGNMGTGGNTLQMQSRKERIRGLISAMAEGTVKKGCDVINFLSKSGCSDDEIRKITKALIKTNYLGDVTMVDGNDKNDIVDEAVSDLEKALADFENGEELSKSKKKDGTYVMKGGFEYLKKADGSYEKMDDDAPDYNGDDDKVEKSMDEAVDVTEDLEVLRKSITAQGEDIDGIKDMLKSILSAVERQGVLTKSVAENMVQDSKMLKSISEAPQGRQTTNGVKPEERFEKSVADKLKGYTATSLVKSMADAGFDGEARSVASVMFRKGGMAQVLREMPSVAQALTKE
ncbi:MAG: hypothetical protein PQJ59_16485 [Spirochaetales bacterium]|nr:hypothetical protein [Spirochaetales bacterium]